MKKYKAKKDFAFSRAGEEFDIYSGGDGNITLYKDGIEYYHFFIGTAEDINNFLDELFEEVKE